MLFTMYVLKLLVVAPQSHWMPGDWELITDVTMTHIHMFRLSNTDDISLVFAIFLSNAKECYYLPTNIYRQFPPRYTNYFDMFIIIKPFLSIIQFSQPLEVDKSGNLHFNSLLQLWEKIKEYLNTSSSFNRRVKIPLLSAFKCRTLLFAVPKTPMKFLNINLCTLHEII